MSTTEIPERTEQFNHPHYWRLAQLRDFLWAQTREGGELDSLIADAEPILLKFMT